MKPKAFDMERWPVEALTVLPCIGSQAQTTLWPARSTARTSGGSLASTLSAPMRAISVMRPGTLSGLSASIRRKRSSGSRLGPHFMPSGLSTPRRNSTWAPSSWRVRSPIHRRWAEQSYHWPVRLSTRVSACS
jgi:hypothetical protein